MALGSTQPLTQMSTRNISYGVKAAGRCRCWAIRNLATVYLFFTRWRSWLRHCATSQKVVGSVPNGVIRIFH